MKLAVEHLPKSARVLVELLGLPATLALVEHYGGLTIWPARGGAGRAELAENISEAAAEKLTAAFREPVTVPRCRAALLAVLHDALRADFDARVRAGDSARAAVMAVARQYRYTDRHVWRLLGRPDTGGETVDVRQVELF